MNLPDHHEVSPFSVPNASQEQRPRIVLRTTWVLLHNFDADWTRRFRGRLQLNVDAAPFYVVAAGTHG